MAQCLVTTLSEAVDNPNIVAPDELVITANHIDDGHPEAARKVQIGFHDYAKVRVEGGNYHIYGPNNVDLGTEVNFGINAGQDLYFPNPPAGKTYKIILTNKYTLYMFNTQEYPSTQYDFFEFDLEDLRHCQYLNALRCMCHKITGDIENLAPTAIEYLQVGRTGVSGDLANLKKMTSLRYFKGSPCDVYGDIAVVKDLPLLRNFEVVSCLEVYGNLSAFLNHTSINYLSLPQVASHPAIEGDIANLAGCTSLGSLNATNEWKITGDIVALTNLDSLYAINLNGTNVYGNIGVLAGKTKLQQINLGNSVNETYIGPSENKITGNIASFAGLPMLYTISLQNTGVTGDFADVVNVPRLASIYVTNTAVTGDMEDFAVSKMPNLSVLDVGNCAGITGDVENLAGNTKLYNLQLYGTNVTGDIGEALEDCTTLTSVNIGNTLVSGDVTKIYKNTTMLTGGAVGCPNVSGDLSQLPPEFFYFNSNGRNGAVFSWSANNARPSSSTIVALDNVDFGDDVEKMLINQAACTPKGNSWAWTHKRINVWGNTVPANMSAACREACETLGSKGYVVVWNGTIVVDPAA